ncbi:uncharacterized protein [Drosophila tropicalis]|uniref:uncharacterized protein n=1 Tax=Drosophila tropicalis TaxID=46794 RepID=UPI0035AC079B
MPIRVNIPTSICMQNLFGFSPFASPVNTMANSLIRATDPMNSPKICISLGPSSIPSQLPQIQESQVVKPVKGKGKVNKRGRKFSPPSSYPFPCEMSTQTSPTSQITPTPNSLAVSEPASPDLSSVIFSQCKLLQNCVELITKQLAISEEKRHLDENSNNECNGNVKSQHKRLGRKADKVREEKQEVDCEGQCLSTDEDSCLDHAQKEKADQPSRRSNLKCIHRRGNPEMNTLRVPISAHVSGNSLSLADSHRFPDTVPKNSLLSGLSDKMLPAHHEYLYAVCPNHYKIKEMPETLVPSNSVASTLKRNKLNAISHHTPSENPLSQTVPVDQFHSDAESQRYASCLPSKRTIPALSLPFPDMQENWRTASYSQTNYTWQEPPIHQQFQREELEENCRKCCLRREPMFYSPQSSIKREDLRSAQDSTSEWNEPSRGSGQQMCQIEDQTNIVRSPRPSVTNNRVNVVPNKLFRSGETSNKIMKTPGLSASRRDRENNVSNRQPTKRLSPSGTREFSESLVTPNPYLAPKQKPSELTENKSRASSLRSSQRQGHKKFLQLPLEVTSLKELIDSTSISNPPTSNNNAQNKAHQMLVRPSSENYSKQNFRTFRRQQSKVNAAVGQNNETYCWANGGEEDTQLVSTESTGEGTHGEESSHVNIGYFGPSQDFALCDYANSRKQQLNLKLLKQIINESSIKRNIHSDCRQKDETKGQTTNKSVPGKASSYRHTKALAKQMDKNFAKPTKSNSDAPSPINKDKLRPGLCLQSAPPRSKRKKEPCQCINSISKEMGLNPFLTRRTRSDIILPCPPSHGKSTTLMPKEMESFRCAPASPSSAVRTQMSQSEGNCECNCHCDFDCNIDCVEPAMEQYESAGDQRGFPTYPPQEGGTEMLDVSSDISQSDEWIEIPRETSSDAAMNGTIANAPVQLQSPCAGFNQAKTSHNAAIQGKEVSPPPTPPSQVVSPRSKTKCKSEVNKGKNMQQLYREMVTKKKTVMLMHPRRLRSAGSVQSAPMTMMQRVVPNRQQDQSFHRLPTMPQESSHSTFSSTSSSMISRQRSGMARDDLPEPLLMETTCSCDMGQFLPPQYPGQMPNAECLGNQQQQMLKQQQQLWQQQQLIEHQRHIIEQYQRPLSGQTFTEGYPQQNNNNNNSNIDYIRECTDCNCWVDPRDIRQSSMGHFQSEQSLSQDYQPYRSVSHQYPVPIKSDQLDIRMQMMTPSFYQGTMAEYGIERIGSNFQPPRRSIECFGQQFQGPQLQGASTSIPCLISGHPCATVRQSQQPQPRLRTYNAPQCPQPMYKHFNNTYTESSTI